MATPPSAPVPRTLGRYQIVRAVGQGGMGTVYEAVDPTLNRRVALKVVHESQAGPKLVARLVQEAHIAARLRHPNIVPVHEVGSAPTPEGTVHFIAMDFVQGSSLDVAMRGMGRRDRLRILETVAGAVAAAHEQGITHRDLKPQNILLEPTSQTAAEDGRWRVFLVDFGLARMEGVEKLTRTGAVMGTPYYMAPEQVRGETRKIGPATDVWALGVLLYELISGRRPFESPVPSDLYFRILNSDPKPLHRIDRSVPRDLEAICVKAMEKEIDQRYRSAGAFAADLGKFLQGAPVTARAVTGWQLMARKLRRNRLLAGTVATSALAIVIALTVLGFSVHARSRERAEAARREEELKARARGREEAIQRLSTLWSTIMERKRELRTRKTSADQARRELEEAVARVDEHITAWPGEPQAYYVRARGRLYLGRFEAAEADLRTAIKGRGDFRPGWTLLATLALERIMESQYVSIDTVKSKAEAPVPVALLREVEELNARGIQPGTEQAEAARWGLPWTREDEVLRTLSDFFRIIFVECDRERARTMLRSRLEGYQAEEYAYWLGSLSPDLDERIRLYDESIRMAPGFERPHFGRGTVLQLKNDFAGAIKAYSEALAVRPDYTVALYNRGSAYRSQGAMVEAMADFDRAVAVSPSYALAHMGRGEIQFEQGDAAGALASFDRAIQCDPYNAMAWSNRGYLRYMKKEYAAALEDLDHALKLYPEFPVALTNRGLCHEALKDHRAALADYSRAAELDPGNCDLHRNRGIMQAALGELSAALASFNRAIGLAPAGWSYRADAERRRDAVRAHLERR